MASATALCPITASMLYDLVQCPHRPTMDLFEDPAKKDPESTFIQLLWERGQLYEREVVASIDTPFLDLSPYAGDEKGNFTAEAMGRGEALIYGGRIEVGDLLGEPDLLRKEGAKYIPGDIKSGAGEEGSEDHRKLKLHYAVQLALYVDILERSNLSAGRRGFVWDINGDEVTYDLAAPQGQKKRETFWDEYQTCLAAARAVVAKAGKSQPAYGGVCKLCHWHSACLETMTNDDDLTLIPELGRAKRDVMQSKVPTIKALAAIDPAQFTVEKKTTFSGVGPDTLRKLHRRANLIVTGGAPYLKQPLNLPASDRELFFDIEVDPFRDVCYLHGFIERIRSTADDTTEKYIHFFADEPTPEAEEAAFSASWKYLGEAQPCVIYYYSKYERTIYRKLQKRYPHVCSAEEVERMFDPSAAVDLYFDVVLKATEWPTRDYSIKSLAKYLGFVWRDAHPSGAASIEWYHRWVEDNDEATKRRILEYNEDDCIATRVLLDGVRKLTDCG